MKTRKRLKIKEADNGFIVECYANAANILYGAMPMKVKVFTGKKELEDFVSFYFSSKELDFIDSNALQEEELQDEGEM